MKKAVLKNFAVFTRKRLCWSVFQVFFCEYGEALKNTYYEEHLRTAASGALVQNGLKGLCIGLISLLSN